MTEQHIAALQTVKADLIAYLRMKLTVEDWHAVQDAASDIRECYAKIDTLKSIPTITVSTSIAPECLTTGHGRMIYHAELDAYACESCGNVVRTREVVPRIADETRIG